MTLRRPLARFALFAGLVGGVLSTPVLANATTSPTVTSVLSAANAQLAKETSVHIEVQSINKSSTSSIKVDLGTSTGDEFLVSGKMKVSILVTPKAAFLSGNKLGLTTVMGLTSAQQKKIGSKWMEMFKGTVPYTNLEKNLTTAVLTQILPKASGTKLATTSDRAKNFQLSWTTAAGAAPASKNVLVIASGSTTLPISQTITSSTGHGTTTYSKWNQRFSVVSPKSSDVVTYKSVFGH
ncbi:MAG: hypothetical protein KGJ10_08140 [Acidobacteriota bacterium]|nr:hypothetical protein [Acidobacteriota bacterium]